MIPSEILKLAAEKGMESDALNPKAGDIPTFADKRFLDVGSDVLRFEKDSNIPKFAENDADTSDEQDEVADSETTDVDDSAETAGEQAANSDVNDGTKGNSADDTENPEQQTDSEAEELLGLTDEEKARIKEETGWSDEIIDHIDSMEQYEILKNAGLEEREINGRCCLVKRDLDLDGYRDPKTHMTNRERMSRQPPPPGAGPLSPIDPKTGEKIELHHLGQDKDGPFVELTVSEHRGPGNHAVMHPRHEDSWRNGENNFEQEKSEHWQERAKGE